MTFPRQISLLALMAFLGLVLSGCQPSDPDSPNVKQLTSIAVTPDPVYMEIGGFASLTVTGTLADNSTYVLNSGVTFASSAPSVATVNAATGYVTAVAAGNATITATHDDADLTATTTVQVSPLRVISIAVSPATSTLAPGASQALTVTATYNNLTTGLETSRSTFVSSDTDVAVVDAAGIVTAVADGSATITATHTASGKTGTAAITVGAGGGGGGESTVLVTFDEVPPPKLTDFGTNGAPPAIATDPAGGTNKVLQVFKYALPPPGSEQWAGVTVSTGANDSIQPIPFTATAKTMTVRVYSPAIGVRVRLKVENASDPAISCETDAITTKAGAWETLTFDFANPGLSPPVGGGATAPLDLTKTYNKVSIFSDFGIGNGGSAPLPEDRVYFYDDITFVGAGGGSTGTCAAPNCTDFSGAGVTFAPFENGGGGTVALAKDPNDPANDVVQFVKKAGDGEYFGTFINGLAGPAELTTADKTVTLRVYSPSVGTNFLLKLEGGPGGAVVEKDVVTTRAGAWETLSFDLSAGPAGIYTAVVLFPGGRSTVVTDTTMYIDELKFPAVSGGGGSGATGTCAPTNCTDFSGGGIVFNVFENPGGGTVELAEDPNDPTNDVVKFVKKTGDNDYFGTVISGLAGPATLTTTNKTVTLRVYSPTVGTNFLFKLEGGPGGAIVEKDMVTTVANAWETLSFDLSAGADGTYSTVVIFPNGRSKVTADKTMYVDELKFPATGGGATAPTDAPTTVIPADAITIYSDAVWVTGLDPFPFWGQNPPVTSSEVTIASNKSLRYEWPGTTGLYQGIDWAANPVDVSTKGKLHIDFWTSNLSSVKVSIISPGLENAVTQALTTGGWNSVDIDLSNYSVPNLTNIIQIKLEPNGPGTLYVDNIYFWGTGSVSADCTGGTFTGGVFAADYRGSLNPADGKPPLTTLCGDIGFFYDSRFAVGSTALYEFGGIANQVVNPGGINNFYYGFGLLPPAITDGYFGAFVNAPANGIANVSSFTNLRFTLWGPAELFEKSFTPQIQVVMAGPVVAGCGSNSGRSEIQAPLVNGQKIGAASNFVLPLSSFTLKFACSGETTVAEILAKVAQVNFTLVGTNIQYSVPDTSTPPAYSNGLNVGPISFN
jgi:hypothetical protein